MIRRSWSECRALYEADEKTWRLSLEERALDWANGRCGQCANTYDDHAVVVPIRTADAVLAQPYPPIDPTVSAYIRGEVILSHLTRSEFDALAALVHLIPDDYPVTTGGAA